MAALHCSTAETCHLEAMKINMQRVTFWLFVCKNSYDRSRRLRNSCRLGLKRVHSNFPYSSKVPMPFNAYSRDLSMQLLGFWTRLLTITGSDYAVDGLRGIFTPSPTMDREIFVLSYLRYQINRRVVNAAWHSLFSMLREALPR